MAKKTLLSIFKVYLKCVQMSKKGFFSCQAVAAVQTPLLLSRHYFPCCNSKVIHSIVIMLFDLHQAPLPGLFAHNGARTKDNERNRAE